MLFHGRDSLFKDMRVRFCLFVHTACIAFGRILEEG